MRCWLAAEDGEVTDDPVDTVPIQEGAALVFSPRRTTLEIDLFLLLLLSDVLKHDEMLMKQRFP